MMYEHYTQMSRRDFNSLKKLTSFFLTLNPKIERGIWNFLHNPDEKLKNTVFPGTSISSWMVSMVILLVRVVHGF